MAYYASIWNKNGDASQRLLLLGSTTSSVTSLPSGYNGTLVTNFSNTNCDVSGNKEYNRDTTYRNTIVEVIIMNKIYPLYGDAIFRNLTNLTTITNMSDLDITNTTTTVGMFYACNSLTSLDLSSFNTSNVTGMAQMFITNSTLTTLDLSSFDTSNVTDMSGMFRGCSNLRTIIVNEEKFITNNVTTSTDMFGGCTSLIGQNGTTYNSSYKDKTYARIDRPGTPGYFTEGKKPIYLNGIQINKIYFNGNEVTGSVYLNGIKVGENITTVRNDTPTDPSELGDTPVPTP